VAIHRYLSGESGRQSTSAPLVMLIAVPVIDAA
jgi:hypothetical protein